ncbi:hypothetical protein B0T10DRAFT_410300 [Thelonectria olida]|uniref:Zn(2)-C6 fungal-type domain-containing protein n=1 Tax=Thelonectria olida TaxID=1576542 RepID=A0A9P8VYJ1_9HYPO|nr:hypothetical protein B0T10DRAFT_410300 [Thelonectria olida]
MSLPSALSGDDAPRKRLRIDGAETQPAHVPPRPQAVRKAQRQRTRAATACAVCRARKTKCDGIRPLCGYCRRTSSACQYDTLDMTPDMTLYGPDSTAAITTTDGTGRLSGVPPSPHLFASSEGLDSILEWRVFPSGMDKIRVDNGRPVPMPEELPPMTFAELTRLQMNYRRVVHSMNPMLDLATLDLYVAHISENGLDFTTRTCLVALVCAIGALCQEDTLERPSYLPVPGRNNDVDIAYRFWSVASKRLGRAMSHNTLESAQCLCLAGIWFMCNLQPLDAWKHFTMAGNCCYSAILARKSTTPLEPQSSPQPIPQAIEHSIFYTAYKSELYVHPEIRYELAIPGSVLEHIEDQLVFPSPPMLSETQLDESNEKAVSWYYYLTDIAARHLINRIINAGLRIRACPDEAQAKALLRDYKIFGSQLEDWHESLPQEISFDPPGPDIAAEPNPFKHMICRRYLFIRELLCRPFVRICLNYALHLPEELLVEITSIASLGLQYCSWRLQSAGKPTRLDHGLWIGIRNNTANAMILVGAGQRSKFPSLNVAARLWMPENWRDHIEGFVDSLEIFSEETTGGVMDCYKLIRWGLEDFEHTADE